MTQDETTSLLSNNNNNAFPSAAALQQQQQQQQQHNDNDEFPSMKTLLANGIILPNIGSTARDHLANERTYLAWIRTSLALIGASLGLLKWDAVRNATGIIVGILGIVTLMTSTERYFTTMRCLQQGKFEPNVREIVVVVIFVIVAIVTTFVLHFVS